MVFKDYPVISIIIPTFNRAHLIIETLDSIKAQTFKNWECIIIDDGSIDNTTKIIANYIRVDSRFKFYKRIDKHRKGPCGCRNYGFSLSSGKYINWFDSDDLMMPDKLEKDIKYINSGEYDFTISQTSFFNDETKEFVKFWNESVYSESPLNDFIVGRIGWSVNAPLWLRKALIDSNTFFNERIFNGDDFDYHIQALTKGLIPHISNHILVECRIHKSRIEGHEYKAVSKSIIVLNLLRNKGEFNLSENTINNQINLANYLLKNMYKHKRLLDGIKFSVDLLYLKMKCFTFSNFFILFFYGLIYSLLNKGYGLIDNYNLCADS